MVIEFPDRSESRKRPGVDQVVLMRDGSDICALVGPDLQTGIAGLHHYPNFPRADLPGVIEALRAAQHVLEMFRRTLPEGASRRRLGRLANRLTKMVCEAHTLETPDK